jgi:hypothetical protein
MCVSKLRAPCPDLPLENMRCPADELSSPAVRYFLVPLSHLSPVSEGDPRRPRVIAFRVFIRPVPGPEGRVHERGGVVTGVEW